MIQLMFIANQPEFALFAESAGVDRIFVDLETLGKFERQGHRDTVISRHSIADVAILRGHLTRAKLLVRVNPWNPGSAAELEAVLAAGADIVMLPMVRGPEEVSALGELIAGRCRFMPLIETVEGAANIAAIAALPCVDEVYIGLNDLHMELGRRFMFEVLADGMVERLVGQVRAVGKPYGFGGIARCGEGLLPAEVIMGEHVRLGSSAVILSRAFHRGVATVSELKTLMDFPAEVARLRECENAWRLASVMALEANRLELAARVDEIVRSMNPT